MPVLTQQRLRELLDYDASTGVFTRRVRASNSAAGTVAGSLRPSGYVAISVDDKLLRAHQLAWLYMTGEWPNKFIDHVDLNKSNNKWDNLRLATKSQNMMNTTIRANNTTGIKGVSPYRAGEKYGKPWQAAIGKDGKSFHVGHFATKEEAASAYARAAETLHGEFARTA